MPATDSSPTLQYLFGPLSTQYCIYFYFLSMIGLALFAFAIISALFIGISKKRGGVFYYQMALVALGYAIFYFQNRLLYSMCVKSL